jgi:enoyl-CoA hydratase
MVNALVRYRLEDSIAILTMDDGRSNALSPTMMKALSEAFSQAEEEASVVILEGRPGRFSTGFDSKLMMGTPDEALGMVDEGCELFLRLYEFPKPVVVAVTGHALAAGILLAATGDTRIGIQGLYKFGLNEVKSHIPVPIFVHALAKDRLIPQELLPAVLHSRAYKPKAAMAAGWLDMLVEAEQLTQVAKQEAKRLSSLSTQAYQVTKQSLRQQTVDYIRSTKAENFAQLRSCLPIKK